MDFQTFPQPTRPSSCQYSTPISEPSTSNSSAQHPNRDEDELFGELTRILFDCLENVDNVEQKSLLFRKIFMELEKECHMENFIVEKLKYSQVKVISDFVERHLETVVKYDRQQDPMVNRGFKEDSMEASMTRGSKSKFSRKLERFKVKTIRIEEGVIKK